MLTASRSAARHSGRVAGGTGRRVPAGTRTAASAVEVNAVTAAGASGGGGHEMPPGGVAPGCGADGPCSGTDRPAGAAGSHLEPAHVAGADYGAWLRSRRRGGVAAGARTDADGP